MPLPPLPPVKQFNIRHHRPVQFYFDEAVDALKLHGQPFQAESNELREVEGERPVEASLQQDVIPGVVQVEVILDLRKSRVRCIPVET